MKQVKRQWSADPAAEVSAVHALNVQLRKILKWLPHDETRSYSFFCECGCYEPGELTIAEYDALEDKPIYLEGHRSGGGNVSGRPRRPPEPENAPLPGPRKRSS